MVIAAFLFSLKMKNFIRLTWLLNPLRQGMFKLFPFLLPSFLQQQMLLVLAFRQRLHPQLL